MPSPPAPTVIVLAAGRGTRMRSATPKVLHDLCGRPLIGWVLEAARTAGAHRTVVVDQPARVLEGHLPAGVESVEQHAGRHGDGTAGAVIAAAELIDPERPVVVLTGDAPLVTGEVVTALLATHAAEGNAATVLSAELDDPGQLGRVVRDADGAVVKIVETKVAGDATEEELLLREVNAGVYCFAGDRLLAALPRVGGDNAQGEKYLPDVLGILRADGDRVGAHRAPAPEIVLGANDRAELAVVRELMQARIHQRHLRAGVTIVNPASTVIDDGVAIAPDVTVEPGCVLRGTTTIGERAVVGPHTTLIDATVGEEATVLHSHVVGATAQAGATIGPFTYLRPGTLLREGAKAGAFVEIKNSDIGTGTKVPHLSYIGDADVGPGTNLGAATITANYDGYRKHRTTIGANVHTSVDTTLVAPVTVGDDAYTGAGSVITKDVPAGALGIARERQKNLEGYAEQAAARARERG
ncbi:bifunctional UDP-N-acetylglucosamine diphosphorylase/glucosamine-1-phosphate N-acetyltransferase GlmU [Patulibacter sp. SYSU D01012]|uniref:bifunctional UDP-N-acetylglucosamine diphosphorylase/glucosamine-1-phosphate N-acetyltransferase GlmU n=1 Tax=Patulibacter sp. SYSU D01012 TaxID=2817381 RepID=UPI001B30B538